MELVNKALRNNQAKYRLWGPGNYDFSSPTDEFVVPLADSPIDAPWVRTAFRSNPDDGVLNAADNLVIATLPTDVGLTSTVDVEVDRTTGTVTIASSSTQANVVGYTMTSSSGSLDPVGWTPIAGNYDAAGDGSVDDTNWQVMSNSIGGLVEMTVPPNAVDGASLGGSTIDLGNAWIPSPFEDVEISLMVNDGGQVKEILGIVTFTGSRELADLSGDGVVDVDDWTAFKSGQNATAGLSFGQAYRVGDMDGDLDHDLEDFRLFQNAYDEANGLGAFDAMLAGVAVPEPSSVVLLGSLLAIGVAARRSRVRVLLLALCFTFGLAISTQAETYVKDSFTYEGSGSGWRAGDIWNIVEDDTSLSTPGYDAFRITETPIDPFDSGQVYIAFDMEVTTLDGWGGLAFFEEDDLTGQGYGAETLFIGQPFGQSNLGISLNQGDLLMSSVSALPEGTMHRMVVGIDFDDDGNEPFQDIYSLWVDNDDIENPSASLTIENSPILNSWKAVRIAGSTSFATDNLVITDNADEAFAKPLQLQVDPVNGTATVVNPNNMELTIDSYSLVSESASINLGGAAGDYNADGEVNLADYTVWRDNLGADAGALPNDPHNGVIGMDQYDTWKANFGTSGGTGNGWLPIAEQSLPGVSTGTSDGSGWEIGSNPSSSEVSEYFLLGETTVAAGGSITLGQAFDTSGTDDLVFTYQINGERYIGGKVSLTGSLAATTVPEPSTLGLAVLMLVGFAQQVRCRV
ncbi:PEP-CTERM sorting domain-containing protein [Aeoliella mucimassa]|uniref:PEP-CTERM motif protein n=1 Tax=Aeoliella mucimassa TaxID=2527972 RepID=A0A518AP71_9BACT|nr:PEP-CTERM sorting domain-containing protein [Aeoliella mucimassa]QDU56518.1 PEP-CTERM motif protein [Aeoliella mucimassa]